MIATDMSSMTDRSGLCGGRPWSSFVMTDGSGEWVRKARKESRPAPRGVVW